MLHSSKKAERALWGLVDRDGLLEFPPVYRFPFSVFRMKARYRYRRWVSDCELLDVNCELPDPHHLFALLLCLGSADTSDERDTHDCECTPGEDDRRDPDAQDADE